MPKSVRAVGDELVELGEAARIAQQVQPLARGQLAGLVLPLHALRPAARLGAALELLQPGRAAGVVAARRFGRRGHEKGQGSGGSPSRSAT